MFNLLKLVLLESFVAQLTVTVEGNLKDQNMENLLAVMKRFVRSIMRIETLNLKYGM